MILTETHWNPEAKPPFKIYFDDYDNVITEEDFLWLKFLKEKDTIQPDEMLIFPRQVGKTALTTKILVEKMWIDSIIEGHVLISREEW